MPVVVLFGGFQGALLLVDDNEALRCREREREGAGPIALSGGDRWPHSINAGLLFRKISCLQCEYLRQPRFPGVCMFVRPFRLARLSRT